jgi:cytidylate kinase
MGRRHTASWNTQVISVRVCAPMNFRVRIMMDRLCNSNAKAVREEIEKFDVARARAVRSLFNLEEEDSRLYHLVLNMERLPLDACVTAVCELAEGSQLWRSRFHAFSARRQIAGGKDQFCPRRKDQYEHCPV